MSLERDLKPKDDEELTMEFFTRLDKSCRCTQRGRKTIKRYRGTCLLTFLLILLVDTCLLPKGKQAEQNGTVYLSILQRRAPPSRCWANAEREQTCSR